MCFMIVSRGKQRESSKYGSAKDFLPQQEASALHRALLKQNHCFYDKPREISGGQAREGTRKSMQKRVRGGTKKPSLPLFQIAPMWASLQRVQGASSKNV